MKGYVERRTLLASAAAAAGLLALGGQRFSARAQAIPTITGVTWGGPWVKAWKAIAARQHAVEVDWVLHAAATTAIVAKIKASWPNPPADFINASEPTIYAMMREGWLMPVTEATIPNLKHLPSKDFIRNAVGEIVATPTDETSVFWAYNEPAVGMPITKAEDLLSPKLQGKIMLNEPTIGSGAQLISLARARGGSEYNVEPGFQFITELIKAGNIGSVVKTDVQVVNAFTTGQVAIGVINTGNYHEISKHIRLTLLNKVGGSPTFKTFIGFESVAILKKAGNRKPVTDFINFCLDAENNASYNATIGAIPTNDLAVASPELEPLRLHNAAERREFGMDIDRQFVSAQTAPWNRKWELEIQPLL